VVTLAVSGVCAAAALQAVSGLRARLWKAIEAQRPRVLFAALTIPFLAGYLLVLAHQGRIWPLFDRYLVQVSAIVVLYLACLASGLRPARPSPAGWAALAILAGFAIANTHDLYAANRAKLAAADWLIGQGNPRHSIAAGYEYDTETQLAERGVWSDPIPGLRKHAWYLDHADAVTPLYYVVSSRQHQLGGVVREIAYRAWLAPTTRTVLVQRAPGEPAGRP
jgi:hypothetical protein